jgi:beta-lactamase regulating signal transducer with metallopeptidase domain/protein involved in polysaccharide export with SLBB domain
MNRLIPFYPGDAFVLLAANVLAQIAVVVALACAVSWIFARHRAAARHAIWLSALGCVLLSPIAAYLSAKAEWSLLSLRLLPRESANDAARISDIKSPISSSPHPNPLPMGEGTNDLPSPFGRGIGGEGGIVDRIPDQQISDLKSQNPRISLSPIRPLSQSSSFPSPHPNPLPNGEGTEVTDPWREMIGMAAVLWAAGSLVLLGRLLHGCWSITRLRRRLQPIDSGRLAVLSEVRHALNATALPPIAVLPGTVELAGPITLGLFRPVVVLPEKLLETLDPAGLRDVLVHEFAHALRRDPLIGFIQRLAAIVYWPYPPVHFLNRRLAWAREEVCDNYVLRQGDAPSYAETLLAVSQTFFSKRTQPAALGLFHPYGKLERRVAELLDPRRNVMVRTHRVALGVLAATFSTVVVLVACTRLLHAESPEPPSTPAAPTLPAAPAVAPAVAPAESKSAIERRAVNKRIKDFPEKADLSTPESALAAYVRAEASADVKAVVELGCFAFPKWEIRDLPQMLKERAKVLELEGMNPLEDEILEVLTYRDDLACVVVKIKSAKDSDQDSRGFRYFGKINGQWKNLSWIGLITSQVGHNEFESKKDQPWQFFTEVRDDVHAVGASPLRREAAPGGYYVFGPVIERTIHPMDERRDCLLDLDTGKLSDAPEPKQEPRYKQWLAENGLDLMAREDFLLGMELAAFPMPDVANLDEISSQHELTGLDIAEKAMPALLRAGKELPATFSFKTREGTKGVLQIVGFEKSKLTSPREPNVKIRYRLLGVHLTNAPDPSVEAALNVIQAFDLLQIRVVGTMLDQPIDGFYLVEPSGKVALGPAYGRVKVKGLTWEQAEKQIVEHLKDVLAKPEVQVSLARRGVGPWREAVLPKTPYKIGVSDVLQIRVAGTLLDQPIDGFYLVESTGTVALGPTYGRVYVKGYMFQMAEMMIHKKLSEILKKPEVQVTLARTADQKESWREIAPPKDPYKIGPGALLTIKVVGTPQDQPIDGDFTVEPAGTVALGPAYGRAQVNGMTFEEAQAAIQKKLGEILQKPEVQVTFAGWRYENYPLAHEQAAEKASGQTQPVWPEIPSIDEKPPRIREEEKKPRTTR